MCIQHMMNWHRPRIKCLLEEGVDFLAVETIPAQVSTKFKGITACNKMKLLTVTCGPSGEEDERREKKEEKTPVSSSKSSLQV